MRRLDHTLTYPDATVVEVYAMLVDPEYRTAVSVFQHVTDFSCQITPDGTGAEVSIEQAHGTDRIPAMAQKLTGPEIRFLQHETWGSPDGADVNVTVPGKPGDIRGTIALDQDGADVTQHIDIAVRVSIPLVGGKLEEMIGGFVGRVFDAQNTVGVKWLRGEWPPAE
ncbi:MAG: DUF2505 domain-containing protein [Nocardioides sp.]